LINSQSYDEYVVNNILGLLHSNKQFLILSCEVIWFPGKKQMHGLIKNKIDNDRISHNKFVITSHSVGKRKYVIFYL